MTQNTAQQNYPDLVTWPGNEMGLVYCTRGDQNVLGLTWICSE